MELIYAAFSRCPCGAGMAYPKNGDYPAHANRGDAGPFNWPFGGWWDCSAILLGEAVEKGQPGSVEHTAVLPFAFYEIKSENQPSAKGATTRPEAP